MSMSNIAPTPIKDSPFIPVSLPSVQPFFAVQLPLPPSINRSYKPVRYASGAMGMALTSVACKYKKDAALLLLHSDKHDYALTNAIRASMQKVPLHVDLKFFFPTLWKRDIDGSIKLILDVVFPFLELNDNLITRLVVVKEPDRKNPRVEVFVRCALQTTNRG